LLLLLLLLLLYHQILFPPLPPSYELKRTDGLDGLLGRLGCLLGLQQQLLLLLLLLLGCVLGPGPALSFRPVKKKQIQKKRIE